MATVETQSTRTAKVETSVSPASDTESGFGDMARSLKDEFASMLKLKSELLKLELKESVQGYTKDGIFMAVAAVLGVFALIFLNVTVAFLLARLFPFSLPVNLAMGALIVTLINGIAGAILFFTAKKRIAKRSLVPRRSVEEMERDKQWLTNELT